MQKIRFRRNPFLGLSLVCVSLVWKFGHARLLGAVGLFGYLSVSYVSSPPPPPVPGPARTRKLDALLRTSRTQPERPPPYRTKAMRQIIPMMTFRPNPIACIIASPRSQKHQSCFATCVVQSLNVCIITGWYLYSRLVPIQSSTTPGTALAKTRAMWFPNSARRI